jgi:hypothetical protein
MVELPPAATVAGPEALPGTGRLQLSSVDAATWLKSMGGEESAATHLILSLADAEDFSIELPKLGCTFQGSGMLEDGAVRFDLVAVDSPDRPLPDCTLNGTMSTAAPVAMGRASVKETSLTVSSDHTLVFTPADRGDGRQRLILWRTIPR